LRLYGDYSEQGDTTWQTREDAWQSFRKSRGGKERLEKSGKAMVGGKNNRLILYPNYSQA